MGSLALIPRALDSWVLNSRGEHGQLGKGDQGEPSLEAKAQDSWALDSRALDSWALEPRALGSRALDSMALDPTQQYQLTLLLGARPPGV